MRCPKCQYISFDRSDRCRNCGYEFSLAADVAELDLPIKTGDEPEGPLADLRLSDLDVPLSPPPRDPEDAPRSRRADRASSTPADLPLFRVGPGAGDAPLVSVPAAPRPPVAVRKAAPVPRPVRREEEPRLDLELPDAARIAGRRDITAATDADAGADHGIASAAARLGAGLLDLLLIGTIDAVVLHFTLKFCGLAPGQISDLPLAPFLAFLALLNGGYFVTFTVAGGQTIGKMAAGIKVVNAEEGAWTERVPLGQAVLRSAAYLASALPLGLGFLPGLVGDDRRAVHDRVAQTRVVKA